jgi:anti-sigma-K factor RskA
MSESPGTSPLTHEAAFPELGALALGALTIDEARLVSAHVETCRLCSAELAAMERVVAAMPSKPRDGTIEPRRSAAIRGRLMARAGESGASPTSSRNLAGLVAIAAALAVIALGLGYYNQYSARRELIAGAAKRDSIIAALNALVRERDAELAAITGPGVSVVELSSTGLRPPTARMFWDRKTNKWTLFAHGLPLPKAGRTYELWLVTADKKIPAGIFKPADDGSAVVRATYALQPADLKAIAITEEPDGGVSAPTGAVVLAGTTGS